MASSLHHQLFDKMTFVYEYLFLHQSKVQLAPFDNHPFIRKLYLFFLLLDCMHAIHFVVTTQCLSLSMITDILSCFSVELVWNFNDGWFQEFGHNRSTNHNSAWRVGDSYIPRKDFQKVFRLGESTNSIYLSLSFMKYTEDCSWDHIHHHHVRFMHNFIQHFLIPITRPLSVQPMVPKWHHNYQKYVVFFFLTFLIWCHISTKMSYFKLLLFTQKRRLIRFF